MREWERTDALLREQDEWVAQEAEGEERWGRIFGDFKRCTEVKEDGAGKEELVIEARSTVGLWAFQPMAMKRGFQWSYQFLSWVLQKRAAARGEGVTRSLARDGWWREARSASTRYIIIHLLLSPKPPASEPLTHQDTFLLQPKLPGSSTLTRQASGKISKLCLDDHCHYPS